MAAQAIDQGGTGSEAREDAPGSRIGAASGVFCLHAAAGKRSLTGSTTSSDHNVHRVLIAPAHLGNRISVPINWIGPRVARTALHRFDEPAICSRHDGTSGKAIHDRHGFRCIPNWSRRFVSDNKNSGSFPTIVAGKSLKKKSIIIAQKRSYWPRRREWLLTRRNLRGEEKCQV